MGLPYVVYANFHNENPRYVKVFMPLSRKRGPYYLDVEGNKHPWTGWETYPGNAILVNSKGKPNEAAFHTTDS